MIKSKMRLIYLIVPLSLLLLLSATVISAQDEDYEEYDEYVFDCTVDDYEPECDVIDTWDGESGLPGWYAEDAIVIDCIVGYEEPECDFSDEEWYAEFGDGWITYIDYGDDGYLVIYEPDDGSYGEDFGNEDSFGDGESVPDASFEVTDSGLDSDGSVDPNQESVSNDIWSIVADLIPGEWLERIARFELFSDDDSTAAYVYPDENNPDLWVLGVNQSEIADVDLLRETLIHELAHIVTLSTDQFSGSGGSCPTVELEEGCALRGTYLAAFYDQFWAGIDAEFQEIMQLDESVQEDALYQFYETYQDQFVSDYAATNIAEDMAESFASFVTRGEPRGSTIADQKIRFFYNYPELVNLRNQLRAGLN